MFPLRSLTASATERNCRHFSCFQFVFFHLQACASETKPVVDFWLKIKLHECYHHDGIDCTLSKENQVPLRSLWRFINMNWHKMNNLSNHRRVLIDLLPRGGEWASKRTNQLNTIRASPSLKASIFAPWFMPYWHAAIALALLKSFIWTTLWFIRPIVRDTGVFHSKKICFRYECL